MTSIDSRTATLSSAPCGGTQNDEELVERAREGDKNAFGELIERYHAKCINIATFILRDRAEAEDMVQKAYCSAFCHLDQYQDGPGFDCWLLRIVKNQCLMLIRVRSRARLVHIDADINRERRRPVELTSQDSDTEEDLMEHEMREVLHREIGRIPPLLRNVLVLRDVQELPMSDVAAQLQITVAAAKSRLLRARQELRERVLVHCSSKERRASVANKNTLRVRSAIA